MAVSAQATIAAACYAVLILTTQLAAVKPPRRRVLEVAALAVSGFVFACVMNCYVTGGCGLLAWVAALGIVLSAASAVVMAFGAERHVERFAERLIVRRADRSARASEQRSVPFSGTPP